MKARLVLLTICTLAGSLAGDGPVAAADGVRVVPAAAALPGQRCPHCPAEEIVYHEVVTHRCRLVPDVKQIKKTVYECKEVPFCLHKLPPLFSHHQKGCCDSGPCPECDCPRYKKVLLKREIVCEEICGTKCVIEEVIERVPCRVCKPCPHCSQGVPGCAQAAPLGPATGSISDQPATSGFIPSLVPAPPVPLPE